MGTFHHISLVTTGSLIGVCLSGFAAFASEGRALSEAIVQAHIDHRKGYISHVQGDYEAAILWYEKAAAAGLAKSEHGIGRILAFDRDGQHDYVNALPWIIRAAEPRLKPQGSGFGGATTSSSSAGLVLP